MKVFSLLFCLLIGSGVARAAEPAGYPRPELLIEPKQLAEMSRDVVVLDARPKTEFDKGHAPRSQWVNHAEWAKAFGEGEDAEGWSKRIGDLGINASSMVVVLDDSKSKDSARIWWILRYWGVKDVRLMNGGFSGWENQVGRISNSAFVRKPVEFRAEPAGARLATKKQLLESLTKKDLQIVDARSEKEFCGIELMKNTRGGAIPGAKQLEWSDLIEPATQRFKSAEELKKLFADAGIDLEKPTATHCQSGGRASVMAFGLELMGAKQVGNYYRSWSEWSSATDTPVEAGKPRKK